MTDKYLYKNLILLINQSVVIAFLVYETVIGLQMGPDAIVRLTFITIMLAGAAYISISNMNNSSVLYSFSGLLVLSSWYFLLAFDNGSIFSYLYAWMGPVIIWSVIRFVLKFVFQGDPYVYKKQIDTILFLSALLPVVLKPLSNRLFSLFFLMQFIISFICCISVIIIQKKRVGFFLKCEWKNLLPSLSFFCIFMFLYVVIFKNQPLYLENSGLFLIICLPLWSMFKVAFKSCKNIVMFMPLSKFQCGIILFSALAFICGTAVLMELDIAFILLALQSMLWFSIVFYLFLTMNVMRNTIQSEALKDNLQSCALLQIKKEEELKMDFSNFLHDDVLQDLLSIKNLSGKSERPEVQELIRKTLENLNTVVRDQMQDYHPVLLKSLSLKENYYNLISAISQKFPTHDIDIIFDCDNGLFLIMPYDLVIYRIIKELTTNVFKHSTCSKLWVILTQINGQIELVVKDNGDANVNLVHEAIDNRKSKGLFSIQEQTSLLGGKFEITENLPKGLSVQVSLPMKGEGSYEHFISR